MEFEPAALEAESIPAPAPGETVLVVEDDALVRRMMVRALEDAGYRVREAGNGQAAVALLRRTDDHVSAVVTDLAMPEMGGHELAAWLGEQHPGVAVVFTSGYLDDEVVRRGLLEAGRPFLQKPFAPEALVRAVAEAMAGSRV